jgi:hypothetical protein
MLAAVPPIAAASLVATYGVDLPLWDQWELIPMMDKLFGGQPLHFADLWQQYNEHRLFFPNLVWIALARASRWDVRWEMAFQIVVWTAVFPVLARAAMVDIEEARGRGSAWVVPILSLLHFTLRQAENWLCGFQVQLILGNAGVLVGLVLLTRKSLSARHMAAAVVAGLLATFSFANGLLFWPIGGFVLVARRASRARLAAFAAVGVLAWTTYFVGFKLPPPRNPWVNFPLASDPELSLSRPLDCIGYALAFIGTPVGPHGATSGPYIGLGAAGIVALAWLIVRAGRAGDPRPILMWVGLAMHAAGSGAVAAIVRSGLGGGADAALSSRYVTIAVLFWEALVVAALIAAPAVGRLRLAGPLLIAVVVALAAHASWAFHDRPAVRCEHFREARATILRGEGKLRPLLFIYDSPDAQILGRALSVLRKHRISMFRDAPR